TPAGDSIQPDTTRIYTGPGQQVDVTFTQPMHPSAAAGFSIVNAETGAAAPGALKWNDAHTLLSFNPTERLATKTRYTVTVDKGLKGAHGSVTASARTSTFTTIALPSVASTSPPDGEKNTQRYGINVQFATPMDPSTLVNKIRISGLTAPALQNSVLTGAQ